MFVSESNNPGGPFDQNIRFVTSGFDPAVLVDDEIDPVTNKHKVYIYWTVEATREIYAAELNPDMATIKPGTVHEPMNHTAVAPLGLNTMPERSSGVFEGPTIRKVDGLYVLGYAESGGGIGWTYSDNPFGDTNVSAGWIPGGTRIDNKGEKVVDPYTGLIVNTYTGGNNHGGMIKIDDQWWQIYHRGTRITSKRQAMATPINLHIDPAGTATSKGTLTIEQAEVTSQGFEINGLDPYKTQYASIACYLLPANRMSFQSNLVPLGGGGLPFPWDRTYQLGYFDPTREHGDWYPILGISDKSWVGYKYFNFSSGVAASDKLKLSLTLTERLAGTVNIYANEPKTNQNDLEKPKTLIGSIVLDGANFDIHTVEGYVDATALSGKKGIYLEFLSSASGEICKLNKLKFELEKFVPVTNITGVPVNATVGTALALSGSIVPANATNKTIAWSVKNAGSTGAKISGSTFSATASGTAVVTATVANGSAVGTAFAKDFTINVKDIPGKVKDPLTQTPVPHDKIPQATQSTEPGAAVELPKTITFPSGAQSDVTWTSADGTVAKVDSAGRLVGVYEGKVTLTATSKTNPALKYSFTVTIAKNVTKVRTPLTKLYLKKGKSLKPPVCADSVNLVTNKADISAKLTWKSSNSKIATVNPVTGKISPKKKGTATITATAMNGKKLNIKVYVVSKAKGLSKVSLVKPPKSIKKGKTAQLKVKATSAKATNLLVKFKSSKSSVIKVDKAGKITALKKGKAKITVTIGKKKYTRTITVK
jgi:uncharacterized protein YjdB